MGLEVYVGPLSRYFAGEWETALQRVSREDGIPFSIVRPGPDIPPPTAEQALEAVLAWRAGLAESAPEVIEAPLEWDEVPDGEYFTDKLDWDGHDAVRLLAAQTEFPAMTLPTVARRDIDGTALWQLVLDRYRSSGWLGTQLRRLVGRRPVTRAASPYQHVYFPELWLPVDFEPVLASRDPAQRRMNIGSVRRLRAQLERLNERTYAADDWTLDAWRGEGPPDDGSFDQTARFGLACWLQLAREADNRRQPMILDW